MKNLKKIIAVGLLTFSVASCSVSYPVAVTNNPVGPKRGVAMRKIFLGIAFGHTDLGAIKAAKQGGITKVGSIDFKVYGGIFKKTYTTIVTGEGEDVKDEE